MAEYYLISQLPSLDGINESSPLPITENQFSELCNRFLSKKSLAELNKLTLIPSENTEKSAYTLIEKWNESERNLRLILAKLRADKMNKNFTSEQQFFPHELMQKARTAIEIDSPLEAEKFLTRCRLDFLEALRPMDTFSEEFIFYYGLKLKLIERIRKFDAAAGEVQYKIIYDSIINEDKTEVKQ